MVQGFVGKTQTPGYDGRDHAVSIAGTYDSETWRLITGYQENGEDFNPEVGFLRREDGFRKYDFGVNHRSRPEGFSQVPRAHTPRELYALLDARWHHGVVVHPPAFPRRVRRQFLGWSLGRPPERAGLRGVLRSRGYRSHPVDTTSARSATRSPTTGRLRINFGVRYDHGGFFGGSLKTLRPSVNVRYGETFNLELSYSRNDIDLPAGSTITNLTSLNASYNFTTRLYAQTLVQHNDSDELWSVNFRVGWLQDANTGLFLVYNETEGIGDTIPSGAGRSLILKFSYLFDVLD